MKTSILALFVFVSLSAYADVPPVVAEKGELLFSDDFERKELGENWKAVIPTFAVENGKLKGSQTRDDHGSVGRTYVAMKDVVVEFKFNLAGAKTFNLVFDDKNFKGSHAGHICRVAIAQKQIRLGDDKEGIMRNDIFAMRKDPTRKAEAGKLLKGRTTVIKQIIESNKWYQMRIEISGDEMRVSLDGKAIGYLKSPGVAHPTKESIHFTVIGKDALFDDVRIWKAK